MAIVLIFKTDDQTTELPLLGKTTVGRSSSCDLALPDRQMSGKHGMFDVNSQGQLFYTDLGSTNGSFLNNSQIHKTIFKLNDILKMGNTTVVIDEKKLSAKERLAVGKSNLKEDDDQTIMVGTLSRTNSIVKSTAPVHDAKESPREKKSVVLNKNLKSKKPTAPSEWGSGKNENVIEQEESSGKTKMLKLDKGLGLGKKKK